MKSPPLTVLCAVALCCAVSPAPAASRAAQKARPYLIVPGFSLGKVQLGQSREKVLQEMGAPTRSGSRKSGTITSDAGREQIKIVGILNVDVWQRPTTPGDAKRNGHGGIPTVFEVLYQGGKVVQITTTLTGYKTKEHLSINSTFQEFEARYGYGEAVKYWSDSDSEREFGGSAAMQSFWDFQKHGLCIESNYYSEDNGPSVVLAISVHAANRPYLFNPRAI